MTKSLTISHLTKRYGALAALSDINLELPLGAFTSLLGPSGSGKTTLLMLLAGVEEVQQGRISYDREDITHLDLPKRRAGIVFQHYALFPNLTVKDNILYGVAKDVSEKERDQKLARLIDMTRLSGLENRYPSELSGGQQQRAAIARALAINPRFLLLDEPLSALDAQNREKIGRELREIQQKSGITTIMVTHDRNEALSLSDYIVVIKDGKVEQAGSPTEIYDQPKTPFVATFAGGMNLIESSEINGGKLTGIRFSDVEVLNATERAFSQPDTFSAELQAKEFTGFAVTAHFLLNDFKTVITAQVPRTEPIADTLEIGKLYAVKLASERMRSWSEF